MLGAVINLTNSMSSLHFRYPILTRKITLESLSASALQLFFPWSRF